MNKIFGHLRNILVHKFWVCYFGRKLGLNWWRCLMHDMSKFSPTEFWESVKYYQGTSSPIPVCKKENGYSKAWQHHKGRNPHHYEYWTDNYDSGTTLIPMPFDCVIEMIADWCAAGRTYQGKNWSLKSQMEWWKNKKKTNPAIHIKTQELLDIFFWEHFITHADDDDHFDRWRLWTNDGRFNYYNKKEEKNEREC